MQSGIDLTHINIILFVSYWLKSKDQYSDYIILSSNILKHVFIKYLIQNCSKILKDYTYKLKG